MKKDTEKKSAFEVRCEVGNLADEKVKDIYFKYKVATWVSRFLIVLVFLLIIKIYYIRCV